MLQRLVYTGLGAGVGTAICYPEDTKEISNNVYVESRKKAMIAYNFVTGGNVISEAFLLFHLIKLFIQMLMQKNIRYSLEKFLP